MSLFGISWRPSQPFKASFNPSKIGLNDLVTGASLFAPGGIAGIGNLGKWSTGNALGNLGLSNGIKGLNTKSGANILGMVNGLGGTGAKGGTAQSTGLDALYQQLAAMQAQNMLQNYPAYMQAQQQAARGLDPALVGTEIARQRASMQGQAQQMGQSAAAGLNAQGINGSGALLDMMNRATQQGNNYASKALDPQAIASRRMQQMQVLGGGADGLSSLMQLMQMQNNQRQVNASMRQPSFLESALGIAGQVAPYMDWSKVFKGVKL